MASTLHPARAASGALPRPRRRLSLVDRVVRVPLGFVWLAVLAVVAVPVMVVMTVSCSVASWWRRLAPERRRAAGSGEADDTAA